MLLKLIELLIICLRIQPPNTLEINLTLSHGQLLDGEDLYVCTYISSFRDVGVRKQN